MNRPLLNHLIFKLAESMGFWRYPADVDGGALSRNFLTRKYREYKQSRPIVWAEKGSMLDAYFTEKYKLIDQPLVPEGLQGERYITISAVGDLMNAKGVENSAGKFYAKFAELIFNANISIANLESTLTNSNAANVGLQINASREQFDILKGHKEKQYTIFCTANNHMLDRGIEGFNTTHDRLEAEGFFYVGTNRSPEMPQKGLIIASNGIKFGFVAVSYSSSIPPPSGGDYLVNVIPFHLFRGKVSLSLLEDQIAYCRSEDCDLIIVSMHWGLEFEFFLRQYQVEIAHQLAEYGADVIISHHAHSIQPYEIYQSGRDQNRNVPIFYGLGNLSSLWSAPSFALSLIVNLIVVKGYVNNLPMTLVSRIQVTPVLQMEYNCQKTRYLQIEKLSELITSRRSQSRNEHVKKAAYYADLVLGNSWRD